MTIRSCLPAIDGWTVILVLISLAGLLGLVILVGSLLYWLLSARLFDVQETPWPLVAGSIIQTLVIVGAVEIGWRRRKKLLWKEIGFGKTSLRMLALIGVAGVLLAGAIE
ncbi:MAG: hypothetical protein HOG12_16975, partial [Alphaproteobacteria bacterium]|nr:hypothetical protein [Alphaproteobacteria bacterium]